MDSSEVGCSLPIGQPSFTASFITFIRINLSVIGSNVASQPVQQGDSYHSAPLGSQITPRPHEGYTIGLERIEAYFMEEVARDDNPNPNPNPTRAPFLLSPSSRRTHPYGTVTSSKGRSQRLRLDMSLLLLALPRH